MENWQTSINQVPSWVNQQAGNLYGDNQAENQFQLPSTNWYDEEDSRNKAIDPLKGGNTSLIDDDINGGNTDGQGLLSGDSTDLSNLLSNRQGTGQKLTPVDFDENQYLGPTNEPGRTGGLLEQSEYTGPWSNEEYDRQAGVGEGSGWSDDRIAQGITDKEIDIADRQKQDLAKKEATGNALSEFAEIMKEQGDQISKNPYIYKML